MNTKASELAYSSSRSPFLRSFCLICLVFRLYITITMSSDHSVKVFNPSHSTSPPTYISTAAMPFPAGSTVAEHPHILSLILQHMRRPLPRSNGGANLAEIR